jgi:hypothetical protein
MLEGKVQGFLRFHRKSLALGQRKIVLKALACKDDCVVQYTLCIFLTATIAQAIHA